MIKLLYKPVDLIAGMVGGLLAGLIFKRVWKLIGRGDAPKPTDERRGWGEILLAATLQGGIFALVKAAVDRGAAEGTRRLTGIWPGDEGQQPDEPVRPSPRPHPGLLRSPATSAASSVALGCLLPAVPRLNLPARRRGRAGDEDREDEP